MIFRALAAAMTTCMLLTVQSAGAQSEGYIPNLDEDVQPTSVDVVFQIPLNLTGLATDITQIQLQCEVEVELSTNTTRTVGTGRLRFNVVNGDVVTTALVVVNVRGFNDTDHWSISHTAGATMIYECNLLGISSKLQRADPFAEDADLEVFRLSPTPGQLRGTFIW